MERTRVALRGIYRDVLTGPRGQTVHDSGWVTNTIVDRGRTLLAGFIKNEASTGIQFLAVGRGLASWDTAGVPAPDPAAADLVTRYTPPIPVANLNLVYLDDDDAVVIEPTNRLQITATLEPGYPDIVEPDVSYPLREFGLFGTLNSTDFMINSVRHPVIKKDASATLVRTIRLYF